MNLKISEINVLPIKPQGGLCGFASCLLNDVLFLGNLALYSSPASKYGFRVVFPNKKLPSGRVVDIFYPVSKEAGDLIQDAIVKEYLRVMDNFHHV